MYTIQVTVTTVNSDVIGMSLSIEHDKTECLVARFICNSTSKEYVYFVADALTLFTAFSLGGYKDETNAAEFIEIFRQKYLTLENPYVRR
jgi:hypothetical protein